jgi:hypothetical protein
MANILSQDALLAVAQQLISLPEFWDLLFERPQFVSVLEQRAAKRPEFEFYKVRVHK